jgi:SAM-dependent methyltransferase
VVVGLDRDPALLARARTRFAGVPGLSFAEGDVLALGGAREFDVVTAARVLQWIDRPADAVARMCAAARPGGIVVVLDYDHTRLVREPAPPPDVARFHEAFLAWRRASGWDNAIAAHLPALLEGAGLGDVAATVEDEIAVRGEPGFDDALDVWARVIDTIGASIVDAGILAAADLAAARLAYEAWRRGPARRQHMVLRAVEGRA